MSVPQVAVTHDVVLYDGTSNLGPVGLIVKPFTYRVAEAPTLVTRMSVGDPKGTDFEAWTSWVQDDFRGGLRQTYAPTPANARFFGITWFLPDRDEGYLGLAPFPTLDTPSDISIFRDSVDFGGGVSYQLARNQAKSFYLSRVAWGFDKAYDRIITPKGAFKVDGSSIDLGADWSTVGGAIDACRYSSCAIIAIQRSNAGYVQGCEILVHKKSWCRFLPHGSTNASALASYDDKLWRSTPLNPKISWYDLASVNDSITPTWSDYVEVGTDGIILRMTPFIGRLFIAKTDGIWAYEAGRTYQVIDLSHMSTANIWASHNFMIFQEAHGALYWNIGSRLYRYTSGGLLEEMAVDLDSPPISATTVRRGLCLVTKRNVYILDTDTGGLFRVCSSHRPTMAVAGMEDGTLRIGPFSYTWNTPSSPNHVARFQAFGEVEAGEPTFEKQAMGFYNTNDQVAFRTSWVDLGRQSLIKSWQRALIRIDGIPTTSFPGLKVYYRTEEERLDEGAWDPLGLPGFSQLGAVNMSLLPTETGIAVFNFPDDSHSRAMQLMLVLQTAHSIHATDERPIIYSVELEAAPVRSVGRQLRRKQVAFNTIVSDQLELLNGVIENSAAWIAAAIYSLSGSGIVHTVAVPFPPPVGHTFRARVQLGAAGAVVPILPSNYSQIPSGCPAADISLVLTEV